MNAITARCLIRSIKKAAGGGGAAVKAADSFGSIPMWCCIDLDGMRDSIDLQRVRERERAS